MAQRQAQRQQIAQVGQEALIGLRSFMQDRQRDQIANSLLAQQQARPATPVTPDTLYGQPSTALSGEEMARNKALGFATTPGKAPDLGGMQAYQMQLQAAKDQANLAVLQAHANYYNAQAQGKTAPHGGTPALTVDPTTGLIWNGHAWIKPPTGPRVAPNPQAKINADMGNFTDCNRKILTQKIGCDQDGYYPAKRQRGAKDRGCDQGRANGNGAVGEMAKLDECCQVGSGTAGGGTAAPPGGGAQLPVTEAFSQARAAIAAGADKDAVTKRLNDAGYDTTNF